MKTKFLHIDEVHTIQSHKDTVFFGCSVYNEKDGKFTDFTLVIPAQIYLKEIASKVLKEQVLGNYKAHLDTL